MKQEFDVGAWSGAISGSSGTLRAWHRGDGTRAPERRRPNDGSGAGSGPALPTGMTWRDSCAEQGPSWKQRHRMLWAPHPIMTGIIPGRRVVERRQSRATERRRPRFGTRPTVQLPAPAVLEATRSRPASATPIADSRSVGRPARWLAGGAGGIVLYRLSLVQPCDWTLADVIDQDGRSPALPWAAPSR